MNVGWQDIAVAVIVILAAASLIRRLKRTISSRRSGGCVGCNCCEKATEDFEPTLIELREPCSRREADENVTAR